MDKSETYIRMSAAAEEIQRQWKRAYGDFYSDETGCIRCWISKEPGSVKFRKGFGVCVKDQGIIQLSRFVWLPKQSQLIEMAQIPGRQYENIVQDFFDWTQLSYETLGDTPGNLFRTMEQIWLAFLMQQKYNRQWDGDTWVRKSESA